MDEKEPAEHLPDNEDSERLFLSNTPEPISCKRCGSCVFDYDCCPDINYAE